MASSKLFFLRPNPLPATIFSSTTHFFFTKPKFPTTLNLFSSAAASSNSLPYGPSLHKGRAPETFNPQQQQQEGDESKNVFDDSQFTRIFDVAALRVPAKDCFALESRLRGHLLNWPRVRNIARVPGDEIESEFLSLLGDNDDDEDESVDFTGEESNSVLYRDRLVKTFNVRGFVKFRNLARISRPKRRKRKEKRREEKERNGGKKDEIYAVEVVEEEEEGEEMRGLLGEEFRGGDKWRGPTRLLLLDEELVDKDVEDFPQAIKVSCEFHFNFRIPLLLLSNLLVVLEEDARENTAPTLEFVRCRLILFYDYWQMNEVVQCDLLPYLMGINSYSYVQILEALLPKGMVVPSAFETVGHIAHLNLRDEHLPYKHLIAKVVLDKNKPKIQTVVNKVDAIHNDYRTMQLEVLAGNHSLVTIVVENGLRFNVDLATVYWNSRLATERQRLLNGFDYKDVVCDVFAGVGPIAISAAKIVKRVYANDLNPSAVDYLERNSVLNKLEKKIKVFNMDGRRFINAIFVSDKAHSITQVVMNLPNNAAEYLGVLFISPLNFLFVFILAIVGFFRSNRWEDGGGEEGWAADAFRGVYRDRPRDTQFKFPTIHVYGFSKARDPEFDFHERIRIALSEVAFNVEMRRVRLVAPGKWMLCASFVLPESVAFAKSSLFM
ncbi:hypothetical protein JRO89_XS15G0133800 [Xanthoceras sorbifolium]|uniref:tRNA (guanine(37)-N1)-methyltransferase n=1 Tax=Xanthoceras sorbifolium TaxID=99658 RepID=A0ABQ8H1Z8_9ROSI|nr:hypothetical protein JRO89_XS15G0133800 [Xanthoceras sorbifolium]